MPGARLPFVLVADDDQDTRELYRACFDTNGYRTAEAGTGSQAIVSAVEIVPDVLLTDFVLPDVDGLTIARRLLGRISGANGYHEFLQDGSGTRVRIGAHRPTCHSKGPDQSYAPTR